MSLWYVRSGGASGCNWNTALASSGTLYTTLASCITAIGTPGPSDTITIAVASDHSESSSGATTLTVPTSPVGLTSLICCDPTASGNPTAALAIQTGGIACTGSFTIAGQFYAYGLLIQCSNAITLTANDADRQRWDDATFQFTGTSASLRLWLGSTFSTHATELYLRGCEAVFNNAGQALGARFARTVLDGCTVPSSSGVAPTTLFSSGTGPNDVLCLGCDFSGLAAGGTLLADTDNPQRYSLVDCALPSGVSVFNGASDPTHARLDICRSDVVSGSLLNARTERYWAEGSQTISTSIYRNGGAQIESKALSWLIATSANVSWPMPFESHAIETWVAAGSHTVSAEVLAAAALNDDDVWIEVQYLAGSSTTKGSTDTSSTKANIAAANAALASSAATWTGVGSNGTQKIVTGSFTTGQAGYIRIVVKAAKPSTTIYVDPAVTVT